MSKLLIDEQPLQVLPALACAIGLNEAMAIQQLHWVRQNPNMGKVVDGVKWIRMTYKDWRIGHFPFWSDATIQRTFESLEEQHLVGSRDDLNQLGFDRTKWYAIDDEAVEQVEKGLSKNEKAAAHSEMIARHSKMKDGQGKMKSASSQDETTIPDSSPSESSSSLSKDSTPKVTPEETPTPKQQALDTLEKAFFQYGGTLNPTFIQKFYLAYDKNTDHREERLANALKKMHEKRNFFAAIDGYREWREYVPPPARPSYPRNSYPKPAAVPPPLRDFEAERIAFEKERQSVRQFQQKMSSAP